MDKIAKERVSNLLGEASRLLSSSSSSSAAVQQNEATRDNGSRLQETLFRARGHGGTELLRRSFQTSQSTRKVKKHSSVRFQELKASKYQRNKKKAIRVFPVKVL